MDLTQLINHPETMDKETLYDLRNMVALYPYYQTARLLMLKNLYLLHDSSFDEELRRAAIYITNDESQHPPTLPSTMWPFCLIVRPKKKRTRRKKTLRK